MDRRRQWYVTEVFLLKFTMASTQQAVTLVKAKHVLTLFKAKHV